MTRYPQNFYALTALKPRRWYDSRTGSVATLVAAVSVTALLVAAIARAVTG